MREWVYPFNKYLLSSTRWSEDMVGLKKTRSYRASILQEETTLKWVDEQGNFR